MKMKLKSFWKKKTKQLKNYLVSLRANKQIDEAYERGMIDGYKKNALEYVAAREQERKQQYIKEYWLVDPHQVVQSQNGRALIGGRSFTEQEVKNLKTEIEVLSQLQLWQIFQETIKQKAIEKAVLSSTDWEQVLAGKMMIHNLGIQKSIVDLIEKI